jgi:hypothetical protein
MAKHAGHALQTRLGRLQALLGVAIVVVGAFGGIVLIGSSDPAKDPGAMSSIAKNKTNAKQAGKVNTVRSGSKAPTNVLTTGAVTTYLSGRSGDITAALYDITTGSMSVFHPGVEEDTASIVKVDILETLLHDHEESGTTLTTDEATLATSMIEESDNDSATDLWDDVDQQAGVSAYNSLLSLADTVPGSDGYWGLTQTTASDQVALLRALVEPSSVLDPTSQAYALGLMENVEATQDWGVSAGVPSGVTVALKNGWLPVTTDGWQINSIGWVDGDGRDYILAVLSSGNPTETYGIETTEGLSTLVWTTLAPSASRSA